MMPRRTRHLGSTLAMFVAVLTACTPAMPTADADRSASTWVGTWGAAPQPFMPGNLEAFHDQTVRLVVHVSAGGKAVRVHVSNTFGDRPLVVGAAHVARRTTGADVDPASDRALTFGGQASVTVAADGMAVSDPVSLEVPALSELAVSLFLPGATTATTSHFLALQTSYVSPQSGDSTDATAFPVARTIDSWPFLTGVEVAASRDAYSIVAFGDSTIDGDGSTPDTNRRWPDVLAAGLHARGRDVGVVNEGMIGNRLLRGSPGQAGSPFGAAFGASGLDRFGRDALAQPGVRCVIVRIGLNDIGFPGALAPETEGATAAGLIAGYRELIGRAHARAVRIVGTTMTPFEGATIKAGYYTASKEGLRQQVNAWLRTSGELDAVVDLDAVTRDPAHPERLLPAFDSGDHLHPNDGGHAATADAVAATLLEFLR